MVTHGYDPARVMLLRQTVRTTQTELRSLSSWEALADPAIATARQIAQRIDADVSTLIDRIMATTAMTEYVSGPGFWGPGISGEHWYAHPVDLDAPRTPEQIAQTAAIVDAAGMLPVDENGVAVLGTTLDEADPVALADALAILGPSGVAVTMARLNTPLESTTPEERRAVADQMTSALHDTHGRGGIEIGFVAGVMTSLAQLPDVHGGPLVEDRYTTAAYLLASPIWSDDELAALANATIDMDIQSGGLPWVSPSLERAYAPIVVDSFDVASLSDPVRAAMYAVARRPEAALTVLADASRRFHVFNRSWGTAGDGGSMDAVALAASAVRVRPGDRTAMTITSSFAEHVGRDSNLHGRLSDKGSQAVATILGANIDAVAYYFEHAQTRRQVGYREVNSPVDGVPVELAVLDPIHVANLAGAAYASDSGAAVMRGATNRFMFDRLDVVSQWSIADDPNNLDRVGAAIDDLRRLEQSTFEWSYEAAMQRAARHDQVVGYAISAVDAGVEKLMTITNTANPVTNALENYLENAARDLWASQEEALCDSMDELQALNTQAFTFNVIGHLYNAGTFGPTMGTDDVPASLLGAFTPDGQLRQYTDMASHLDTTEEDLSAQLENLGETFDHHLPGVTFADIREKVGWSDLTIAGCALS